MKIIDTSKTDPSTLSSFHRSQVYNGLDCCVTAEVLDVLLPQLDNHTSATYRFSRDLQCPVLEMRLRGVLIDQSRKAGVIEEYFEKLNAFETSLERIVRESVGKFGFNWRSNADLQELFYDKLRVPVIRRSGRPTTNRDALEKMETYSIAKAIILHIKAARDLGKKISVLQSEIDPDGRVRTSYNIGGTVTGRLSSSFSEFGTGTNLQNIEETLRSIFISDPKMKMAYFDAEQGESRVVGAIETNLFRDSRYLDACEGGDLHTTVSKLCEPDYGWTGDAKHDKELAEKKLYYRHYTLRKLCKSIGHGSNYMGGPKILNYQYKVDIEAIEIFQEKYFKAFPAHKRWWEVVKDQLATCGQIVTLTGRKRQFWGRLDDPATIREAIAYDPQGSLADILNRGMLNVWRSNKCQLLMQIHDAILVQYPEEKEDEIIPLVLADLRVPIALEGGREFVIPYGCKVGWNWGVYNGKTNPDGLKEYSPGDKRKRTTEVRKLDREVY